MVSKIRDYGEMVMFSHSLFSLPFGIIAMVLAYGAMPDFMTVFWIILALLGARTAANSFNRIADKDLDTINPRTAQRHLPQGKVSTLEAFAITFLSLNVLAVAAARLNPLCLILMPFAAAVVLFYSFTKRITWACHHILGMCCALAPLGAWIAINASLELTPLVLFIAVTNFVAGFDILYATQDIEFDRQEALHSIPARFGLKKARLTSAFCHLITLICFGVLYFITELTPIYLIGLGLVAVLMAIEHLSAEPGSKKRMIFAAYSLNQVISVVFFGFTMLALFL
ncbi:MAG: putative 4-hydroxybenzoate polyprenyltransferase [Turicibacter sp.]|nr:putative 4-hydroxybenzoate polyprenyltransferase [Turicibacter sp.]